MRTPAKTARVILRPMVAALALLGPALCFAADSPPVPNKGDTAWMLTSTAFVLLMSVPALGLFFVGFSLITVLWCVYGYSLAFTAGNAVIGGFSRVFLAGTFDPANNTFALAG